MAPTEISALRLKALEMAIQISEYELDAKDVLKLAEKIFQWLILS